jgi:hypothetical protein
MNVVKYLMIAISLGLLVGCSSQTPQGETAAELMLLQEVNDLLHSTAGATGRPVARVSDLNRYQSMYPNAHAAVKSGNVVVIWGAPLQGEEDGGKDEKVVAYEKPVPTNGGYVLFSAGTVKKLTPGEFESAPKAGKK